MKIIILILFPFICFSQNQYIKTSYIGTSTGSISQPWKTYSAVNQSALNPGDSVLAFRGEKYSVGQLTITKSGSSGNPIVWGAYGTGSNPLIWGIGTTINSLFYMNNRSNITFRDFSIVDTTISATDRSILSKIQRAFYIDGTTLASNIRISNILMDRVGVGAYLVSGGVVMDSCDIGNMRMVVNTNNGAPPGADDDYGANPLVISSANNIITRNYFHDCWAESFDYGFDGGAVEFFGNDADNNIVSYNTIIDNIGISEVTGTATGNKFHYNKLIRNGSMLYFQNSGITGYEFWNNVVIEDTATRVPESRIFGGSLSSGNIDLKNNVFEMSNGVDIASSTTGITHSYNYYKMRSGSAINYSLGTGETSGSSIIFTSTDGNPLVWNYTPSSGSPLISAGISVGLSVDFLNNPITGTPSIGLINPINSPLNCNGCIILKNTKIL